MLVKMENSYTGAHPNKWDSSIVFFLEIGNFYFARNVSILELFFTSKTGVFR